MTQAVHPSPSPQSEADYIAVARTAERQGRTSDAESAYSSALADNPASSTAALALVRLLDARGERRRAQDVLRRFVAVAGTNTAVTAAARQWEAWQNTPLDDAVTIRVAVTGAGTLGSLGTHLRVACAQAGLHPFVHVGEFNQWAQDLLVPTSALHAFSPDVIMLLLDAATIFPKTVGDVDGNESALSAERTEGLAQIDALLDAAARHSPGATVIVNTFAVPDRSPFGILDLTGEYGQRARIATLNAGLAQLARKRQGVLLLDQERVEARHGKTRVRDARMWYLASMPFSESFLSVLAAEYMRFIRPLKGRVRKCIVLDLDNTLWGGVIGEDGVDGIKLGGNDAPGNAFADFQKALDGLRRRGILLALCSKNNPDDAWAAIDGHPHMVLRREHFVAHRINWDDKASNIRAIARELNLGIDSFDFIDDNPAERALMRERVPDALTVELPQDPAYYTGTLLDLDVFESLGLTEEDRARSDMYVQAQARRVFEEQAQAGTDLTSHLESLGMTVAIDRATSFSIPRIAQLINKTNQFNLTTRRYTEAQVREMASSPDRLVYSISVSDRFGDLGLTGVAIVETGSSAWVIDSFLLSCRVLGRGVEDALLAHVMSKAKANGAASVEGLFIPTAKNAPARDFYPTRGFTRREPAADGGDVHVYERALDGDVGNGALSWLQIKVQD